MALWPLGSPMVDNERWTRFEAEYPDMVYGEDYMKFSYKAGGEAVIRMITTDLRGMFPLDSRGTPLDEIPMTKNIKNIQDMNLIINVSAGDPGTKQWVQFAATPFGYRDSFRLHRCSSSANVSIYPGATCWCTWCD